MAFIIRVAPDDPRYFLVASPVSGLDFFGSRDEVLGYASSIPQYNITSDDFDAADAVGSSSQHMRWDTERYIASSDEHGMRPIFRHHLRAIADDATAIEASGEFLPGSDAIAAAVQKNCPLSKQPEEGITYSIEWIDLVLDAAKVGIDEALLTEVFTKLPIQGWSFWNLDTPFKKVCIRIGHRLAASACDERCDQLSVAHTKHVVRWGQVASLLLTEFTPHIQARIFAAAMSQEDDLTENDEDDAVIEYGVEKLGGLTAYSPDTIIDLVIALPVMEAVPEGFTEMLIAGGASGRNSTEALLKMLWSGVAPGLVVDMLDAGVDIDLAENV